MIVRAALNSDIAHVVRHMRAADAREVYEGRWTDDPEHLIDDFFRGQDLGAFIALMALCGADGEAIALCGAARRAPGVASVIMIATDEFPKIALAATRWVKTIGLPRYVDPSCHRAQCEAHIGNVVSQTWLRALGFVQEGVLHRYGKTGADYLLYARLRR